MKVEKAMKVEELKAALAVIPNDCEVDIVIDDIGKRIVAWKNGRTWRVWMQETIPDLEEL